MLKQRTRNAAPTVVITETDYDRLTHLIRSPRYRQTHPSMLASLQEELDRAKVVRSTGVSRGVITMHSQVQVKGLDEDDDTETFTLVYPDEADIDQGKLSVLAPVGTALLGARAGQVVRFTVPNGVRRLRVVKILYQPEAAGDLHL